jgi:hypothetical protein
MGGGVTRIFDGPPMRISIRRTLNNAVQDAHSVRVAIMEGRTDDALKAAQRIIDGATAALEEGPA